MTYLFFVNWKRKKARKEGRMSAILWRDLHLPQPNYLCPKLLFLWSFACKAYERKTSFCLHPSCFMLSINGKGIVGWHILGNINTVVWTTTLRKKSWLGCRSIQSNIHFTTLYRSNIHSKEAGPKGVKTTHGSDNLNPSRISSVLSYLRNWVSLLHSAFPNFIIMGLSYQCIGTPIHLFYIGHI